MTCSEQSTTKHKPRKDTVNNTHTHTPNLLQALLMDVKICLPHVYFEHFDFNFHMTNLVVSCLLLMFNHGGYLIACYCTVAISINILFDVNNKLDTF